VDEDGDEDEDDDEEEEKPLKKKVFRNPPGVCVHCIAREQTEVEYLNSVEFRLAYYNFQNEKDFNPK
jgi:hypothetical protein